MFSTRIILPAVALAGAAALLAVYALRLPDGNAVSPGETAHPVASHDLHAAAAVAAAACDLNVSACSVSLADGGSGQLEILPRPIPAAQPLQVVWREQAGQAEKYDAGAPAGAQPVTVDLAFEGVEMAMGFNRARLTRQADGSYAGNAMLPVCTTGSMRWRARIERGAHRSAASVEFIAPQR